MDEKAVEILNEYAQRIIERKAFRIFQGKLEGEIIKKLYETKDKGSSDTVLEFISELRFALQQTSEKLQEYEDALKKNGISYDSMFEDRED